MSVEPGKPLPSTEFPQPHLEEPQSDTTHVLEPLAQSSNNVPKQLSYKNELQEYTQKSYLQLPVYLTENEGAQHLPKYKSTVLVDGKSYTSQETFAQRKSAEQDAARIALESVHQKLKEESYPIIHEDTTFCKSILNEYAEKMHLDKPSYETIQQSALIPVFVSSLVFNGVNHTGNIGRNKKEAEQLVARTVILSILDSANSESEKVMSGIIKSKTKLYAALNEIKDSKSFCGEATPFVNSCENSTAQLNKRKEPEDIESIVSLTSESSLNELVMIRPPHMPFHPFTKLKLEVKKEVAAPPVVFVPPVSEQAIFASGSGAKKYRGNKKKTKKTKRQLQVWPEISSATVPLQEVSVQEASSITVQASTDVVPLTEIPSPILLPEASGVPVQSVKSLIYLT